jgi:hypothetical protein
MATLDEVLARLEEREAERLVGSSVSLPISRALLGTEFEFDPRESSGRNLTFQAGAGFLGGLLGGIGRERLRTDLEDFRRPLVSALNQPDRVSALRGLGQREDRFALPTSELARSILEDRIGRRDELSDFLEKELLKRDLAAVGTPLASPFAQALSERTGLPVTTEEQAKLALDLEQEDRLREALALRAQPQQVDVSLEVLPEIIEKLPKAQRNTGIKELGIRDNLTNSADQINKIMDDLGSLSAVAAIPFTEQRARLQAGNANLTSIVAQAIKGNPSEGETRRQILPFLVDSRDSDARVEEKRKGLLQFLELNRKPTPLLDRIQGEAIKATGGEAASTGLTPEQEARLAELEAKAAQ